MLAISDTIKILNDDDALELFKKTLPSASLLQTEGSARILKRRALAVLDKARANRRIPEPRMDFIALALQGKSGGTFDQVIGMIDEMVAILVEEQKADDEKKVYPQQQEESKLSFIILDMRACSFLDNDGVKTLKALYTHLDGLEIRLLLAGCKASVRKALQKGNFPPPKDEDDEDDEVSVPVFFISVEKCVHFVHLDLARAALATKLDSSIAEDEITM